MNHFSDENLVKIWKSSFNLSNQAIYWLDIEGNLLFANKKALESLGYTLDELQNLKLWNVDANVNTKEKYLKALERFKNEEIDLSNIIQTIHKKKDGELFPVEVVSSFEQIDGKEYVISYAKDITYRLERTEKINLYFELINSSSDMIFLVDLENEKIEFANKIVCKELGYSLEELNNMKISDIREPVEGEQKINIPEVFEKLQKEKKLITLGIYKTKKGERISVETSLHIKEYLGKNFIIAISRDIGERVEIEKRKEELNKKLRRYNETLEKEVEKVKNELIEYENIMRKQSKMAAMGEIIENIAHQWRQPLSAISVLSSGMIIQNDADVLSKDELSLNLNKIHDQIQYLSKTIDDFRNFFKPDKKKSKFKVDKIIKESIKLIKSRFNALDIVFVKKLDSIDLYSYDNELLQVMLNIINNAVDELINKEYKRVIEIKCYVKGAYVVIKIKDNGGGVSEDIIDRIFEPYFTTKHNYHGTGIGLYMCQNIVGHLQGKIEVKNDILEYENQVFEGACFKIQIPLVLNEEKNER